MAFLMTGTFHTAWNGSLAPNTDDLEYRFQNQVFFDQYASHVAHSASIVLRYIS